jgi:AAA domain
MSEYSSLQAMYSQQLHLHTLDTLCNDLVGGHAVEYGSDGKLLSLESGARSILSWYRDNPLAWTKNVFPSVVQDIIDSLDKDAPNLKPAGSASNLGERKLLTLIKLEAHRFAGIHAYGIENQAPENFILEPTKPITMFEGANGSGKTSLMNAIIWCLTGEIIRPQRPPERGDVEFEIEIERDEGTSTHSIPPVTPMPQSSVYVPQSHDDIPIDTWVELTFEDQNRNVLPVIRRTVYRNNRGKIQVSAPDLSKLGIDPISFRIGTTMPALLPFIQIGKQSELGRAVAELTGLSSLLALSKHATKVRDKISGELTKNTEIQIRIIDQLYGKLMAELEAKISEYAALKPQDSNFPRISDDKNLEENLENLKTHFENCKARSFADAVFMLGTSFDARDQKQIKDLESKISPAILKVDEIRQLSSANRLASLAAINDEDLKNSEKLLQKICNEAAKLADLANSPDIAKRNKLYARIADWMKEFSIQIEDLPCCPVCSTDLGEKKDSVTSTFVRDHIEEHLKQDSALISQSIQSWVKATIGILATELPESLFQESGRDLPKHPVELIKTALTDEFFLTPAFNGVLSLLKENMKRVFDSAFADYGQLRSAGSYKLPAIILPFAYNLQSSLDRIERAISFSRWRQSNKEICVEIHKKVIGFLPKEDSKAAVVSQDSPLLDRLFALQKVTHSAAPINECLAKVNDLKAQVSLRRVEEKKLVRYAKTVEALASIIGLGDLAAQQITDLQNGLKQSTERWRDAVYKNYYSKSGHSLADTKVALEGQVSISMGSDGAIAPAQHVSNASALRASLLGFYIAFWNHILSSRGGIRLMLLDDPQELLDEQNEERLADALVDLTHIKAQLFVTTHDHRFATMSSKVASPLGLIEHRSVHPVNLDRHTLQIPLALADIEKKRKEFLVNVDDAYRARDYVSECRIFIEARLSDLFDDPAYSTTNHHPTLMDHVHHARSLKNQNPAHELFGCAAFQKLCNDSALLDGAKCLTRLNAAHHKGKQNITPSDVNEIRDDLERLVKLADGLNREFRLYRRREPLTARVPLSVTELTSANSPKFNVPIFPDLAAFTAQPFTGGSQDTDHDLFSSDWFADKALFYVRNDMFGFSAPAGSIAIVEINGEPPKDQNLVIAKHNKKYLARRLLRDGDDSKTVTLATVSTDPRARPPSLVAYVDEVELFRVVGFLFGGTAPSDMPKKHDAVQIQTTDIFQQIKTCHRIKDYSAEPLALVGQLVLGGKEYLPDELIKSHDQLVAVALNDGSGIFKRFRGVLPGQLSYLCQFESIGGKGASIIASLNKTHGHGSEIRAVETARQILGVIYEE